MKLLRNTIAQGGLIFATLTSGSVVTGCSDASGDDTSNDDDTSGDDSPDDTTSDEDDDQHDSDAEQPSDGGTPPNRAEGGTGEASGDAGSDDGAGESGADSGASAAETDEQAAADASLDDGPGWFVVSTQIYGDVTTSYLPVVSSLDVDEISLEDAKEVDGRSSIAQVGKWLYVAASSEPVVTRYTIGEDGSLDEDGRLNFANYGVPEFFAINAWGAVFVNEEKAYIFNGSDGSHVIWNPTTMQITGEIAGPGIVKEGYDMESVAVVRGDRMYRLFTFLNYDTWEFLPEPQYLAVYDVQSDELLDLEEETRCVQLYALPSVDENDDIYFSGHVWTPGLALTSDYPRSCSLRVKAGEDDFDDEWQLDFAEVTDGREAATLRYIGDGKALLDVFHDERTEITEDTDPYELVSTANWRLWLVDLEDKSGAPIESVGFKGAGLTDVKVGNRTYLMLPNADWSETTAWELVGNDVVERFKIQGNTYQTLKF